jgi:sugar phosphate isomerase/epimerase
MRFGVCAGLDKAPAAAQAGWDFLEVGVGTFVPAEPDSEYAPIRDQIAGLPLPVEAANCFIPGEHRLTGPDVDLDAVLAYVDVAMARMSAAGLKVVVLGSGGARNLRDDWPLEEGLEQLATFLSGAAPLASNAGMTIAVEPLRRAESNIINRVSEAADLCKRVGHSAVRPLADFFHMTEDGEPPSEAGKYASQLAHVHVADAGRVPPGEGQADFAGFFRALAEGGYGGRVSVECGWEDFGGQQALALQTLRAAWPAG